MTIFEFAACLIVLAAVLSYVNFKFLRLPTAIGVTALTLTASLLLVLAGSFLPGLAVQARDVVARVDFQQTFLQGMLGFMLFAGSLRMNLGDLTARKWPVAVLSTVGIVISTAVVGLLTWGLLAALAIDVRPVYCLLFGALISPTDPIAEMAILRHARVPHDMEVTIAGESLFNDGVGVAVFLALLGIAGGQTGFEPLTWAGLFLWDALGGAILGYGLGWIVYRMIRSVDNYQVEVLLSVALVAGGYALINALHMSGPIAMVVAGLLIGNLGGEYAMSATTVHNLHAFWEVIDEVLNAVLFVLIGVAVLALNLRGVYLVAGALSIPIVLLARLVSISVPLALMTERGKSARTTIRILTWGGLRGGISVALALSIPSETNGRPVAERDVIVVLTYVVVVFSILVQGLTVGPLARRWLRLGSNPLSSGGSRVSHSLQKSYVPPPSGAASGSGAALT